MHSLKTVRRTAVISLNTTVFNAPHDRLTRTRFREFIGFPIDSNLTEKIKTIKQIFTLTIPIQIANILNIEIYTDPAVSCENIFQTLTDLADLKKKTSTASLNSNI